MGDALGSNHAEEYFYRQWHSGLGVLVVGRGYAVASTGHPSVSNDSLTSQSEYPVCPPL
jgi:hypothetical protein